MPDLIYNVKFQIDDSQFQKESAGVERYKQEIEEANAEIAELKNQLGGAVNKSKQFVQSNKNVQGSTARMNTSFSTANQTLFSFSDGLQDSAQFQQGFGAGMRAIGNNVGFTAELMGNLRTRVDQYNASLVAQARAQKITIATARAQAKTIQGELLASLKGPGGLLIGINLVVTAITILSNHFDSNRRKAEKAAEGISGVASSIEQLAKKGSLEESIIGNLEKSEKDIEFLVSKMSELEEKAVMESIRVMEGQSKSQRGLADAREAQLNILTKEAAAVGIEVENLNDAEKALEGVRATKKFLTEETESLEIKLGVLADTIEGRVSRSLLRFELGLEGSRAPLEDELAILTLQISGLKGLSQTTDEYLPLLERLISLRDDLAKSLEDDAGEDDAAKIASARADRELQAQREIRLLRAEAESDERTRLEAVRQVRTRNLQERIQELKERGEGEALTESEIALEKLKIEQEYQEGINRLRDESLQREKERLQAQKDFQAESRRAFLNPPDFDDGTIDPAEEKIVQRNLELMQRQKDFRVQMVQDFAQTGFDLAKAAFGERKEIAIAEALISTYFAAQKAYESQFLPVPDPSSPVRGAGAAAAAVVAGLARVAQIKSTSIGGGGGGGGATGSGASSSFGMQAVEGEQRFRTPQYQPRRTEDSMGSQTNVQIMADRKQLYALVNKGQQEYNGIKTRTTATS